MDWSSIPGDSPEEMVVVLATVCVGGPPNSCLIYAAIAYLSVGHPKVQATTVKPLPKSDESLLILDSLHN